MDWSVITSVFAAAAAAAMAWKMRRLKKDIYEFADSLEENLDAVIQGKEPENTGDTADSLSGKLNEKLHRVNHILEQKEQEVAMNRETMKELISDISHQTKTPIANQKIYLEILKSRDLSADIRGFVDRLEHQTDKLEFLFDSMVKMSRLETGVIQIQKENSDLVETIGRAVAAIVPSAEAKGIRLSVEVSHPWETEKSKGTHSLPEQPAGRLFLCHDRKWTEEAVYNLLDNGVKYTQRGGSVTIRLIRREIFTEIHVRDTGKGIAVERQAQIFTRFYREPEVHDREGVGIGLYLTRKIAELQSGYVEVKSEPGEGADFCIYLPNG